MVADQAEVRKKAKYAELATTHHFIPLVNKITRAFRPEYRGFARAQLSDQEESGVSLPHKYLLPVLW